MTDDRQDTNTLFDVAVVGGGFGGSSTAILLARQGLRVALIDLHKVYPPDFRAEKIAGDQIERLRSNGLLDCLAAASTPVRTILNARRGRVVDEKEVEEYGILYEDMVAALRAELPSSVTFIVGRVAGLETSDNMQQVVMSDGSRIEARLIVLATGLGEALRKSLGVKRRMIRDSHSLSVGFSIKPAAGQSFPFSGFGYYGETPSSRVDYISVFPIGYVVRANLFAYRDYHDAWTQSLRVNAREALYEVMPGARRFLGDFEVTSKVELRIADLMETENHLQPGVVLIGDAFRTSCPSVGSGLSRLLADVDRLCNAYAPQWLATPGMGTDKIAAFYADDDKRACDERSARAAEYRRASTLGEGLRWEVHRRQHFLRRQVRNWLKQVTPRSRAA